MVADAFGLGANSLGEDPHVVVNAFDDDFKMALEAFLHLTKLAFETCHAPIDI